MSHDTIISGATIIDGTGGEPISADIAIDGERISRIGDLTGVDAGRKIDAEGKAVANKILSASLTDKILKEKGIEATLELSKSQNSKVVVVGSGKNGLPIILGNQ